MLGLLQSFGTPVSSDALGKFLLGSLVFLTVAVWSILDAVKTARHQSA
jgi:hypothetical protein